MAANEASPPSDARLAEFRLAAPLHAALRERDYNAALAAMPLARDIDAIAVAERGVALQPLCLAAQDASADAYDMVRALVLRYGAKANVRDGRGYTPLHYAARNGNLAVVELLLEQGADVNATVRGVDMPVTPLYLAAQFGMNRVAEALRLFGAEAIDAELLSQLRVDAAVESARNAALARVGEAGTERSEAVRAVYAEVSEAAIAELEAAGRFQEASIWRQFEGRAAELVIQGASVSTADPDVWIAVISQKLLTEIQASVQEFRASGDSR